MNRQQQIDSFLLAAHRLAIDRLRADPARIEPVRAQLSRWRERSTRADTYSDEWQRPLAADTDVSERAVCADDEHGALLRSVSPMSSPITPSERSQLLRDARTP